MQNVQLSGQSPKTRTSDEQAITFTDEDVARIHHPHDDAIVITMLITDEINFIRCIHPLVGFGGMKVQPVSTIMLPVVVGAHPQQVT